MFAAVVVRESFVRLGICLLLSCLPLIAMAQLPFVSKEEALSRLESQLEITTQQRSAFMEAMEGVYALRENFRARVAQSAGGQGVELDVLMSLSEQLQAESEKLLQEVLSPEQLMKFRESNGTPVSIAN